jgi:predicted nucleic acid-binding protein
MGLLLIIDDRAGRAAARQAGVKVAGTLRVLLEAKVAGLIPAVSPLVSAIRSAGYYLADSLVEAALREAGEAS